jgi:hypothetical protein
MKSEFLARATFPVGNLWTVGGESSVYIVILIQVLFVSCRRLASASINEQNGVILDS